jgi:hypothetical protein
MLVLSVSPGLQYESEMIAASGKGSTLQMKTHSQVGLMLYEVHQYQLQATRD